MIADRGTGIYKPFVRLQIVTSKVVSDEVDALLDTGAGINLVSMGAAEELMEMKASELRHKKPREIGRVDREKTMGWAWEVTLRLRGTTGEQQIDWERSVIYVTDAFVPHGGILIGQDSGLQGRAFIHLNYPNRSQRREWEIRPGFTLNPKR